MLVVIIYMRIEIRMTSPNANPPIKRGRPATGKTRTKVSLSVPSELLKLAQKMAAKSGESLSQYVARSIQNQTLS